MGRPLLLLVCLLMVIPLVILPASGQIQASSSGLIKFNETLPGERNTGQLYTFQINNVSGRADSIYHYTVYASRLIGDYFEYHNREWNNWQREYAAPGMQYLVVWVRGWLDPESGTTWIGWGPERFNAWVWGNRTIRPDPVKLEDLPIRYGSDKFRPVLISTLFNRTMLDGTILTTDWYSWELWEQRDRMEPGESNAWDGIIIYQVPKAVMLSDIQIGGWFGYFGTAWWNLEDRIVEQLDSIENQRLQEQKAIAMEKQINLRISDRDTGRRRS